MENLNGMTVAELRALKAEITDLIASKVETEKAEREELLASRDAEMRGKVKVNDLVAFEYNKGIANGKALRLNEKSVTVEFERDGETATRYVTYSKIVEVVE
jgi:hypothetical protein